MDKTLCAFCGKNVLPPPLGGSDVREGQKRFHIGCYYLYKRPARQAWDHAAPQGAAVIGPSPS